MTPVFPSCMTDEAIESINSAIQDKLEELRELDCFDSINNFQLISQFRRLKPLSFNWEQRKQHLSISERVYINIKLETIEHVLWDRGLNISWDWDKQNIKITPHLKPEKIVDYYEQYDELLKFECYLEYQSETFQIPGLDQALALFN